MGETSFDWGALLTWTNQHAELIAVVVTIALAVISFVVSQSMGRANQKAEAVSSLCHSNCLNCTGRFIHSSRQIRQHTLSFKRLSVMVTPSMTMQIRGLRTRKTFGKSGPKMFLFPVIYASKQ